MDGSLTSAAGPDLADWPRADAISVQVGLLVAKLVELPSVEGALAREESDTIGEGNGVAQTQSTPNGTLTQQELESRLWAAANSLR